MDVDPEAWAAAKAQARELGIGVGEYVGQLVKADVARAGREHILAGQRRRGVRRERYFARVAVDKDTWAAFVARAHAAQLTVPRQLGFLVEADLQRAQQRRR